MCRLWDSPCKSPEWGVVWRDWYKGDLLSVKNAVMSMADELMRYTLGYWRLTRLE